MTMTGIKRLTVGFLAVAILAVANSSWAESFNGRVRAFQTNSRTVWLSAGSHQVIVRGDGDTDLDLSVQNSYGRVLAADEGITDFCVGTFYLSRGAFVTIRIQNLGDVYNDYRLTIR